jgi:hypothetical protein
VSAFEVKTKLNKYFNIERMGEVQVLNTSMKYENQHEFYKPDVFGFQWKSMNKEIEIRMSIRAWQVLREEYPMTIPYIKPILGSDDCVLCVKVQSYIAPGRFVLGFFDEVKIIGSKEFIRYINGMVRKQR